MNDNFIAHFLKLLLIELGRYIFIYYTGKAKTNLADFDINNSLEDIRTESYGFKNEDVIVYKIGEFGSLKKLLNYN